MSSLTKSECGAVYVLFAGVLSVVALFAALAIDLGHLYRGQIALQKSADAAALAGIGYTTRKGKFGVEREARNQFGNWSDSEGRDRKVGQLLVPKAREVAWATMGLNGFAHVPGDYKISMTGDYVSIDPKINSDVSASFRVTLQRRVDFLLIDLLPTFTGGGFRTLSAVAKAERKTARVVTFIDVSDSMNCPADGDCDCWLKPNTGVCPQPNKMDKLVEALKSFIKMFDPARDKFFVVPFNIRGRAFSLADYAKDVMGFGDLDQVTEAQIDALVEAIRVDSSPEGSTNICDAFMRGISKLEDEGIFGSKDVSYVLFSDGAPTAGRWLFSDPKPNLLPWEQGKEPASDYDYTGYTVEWVDPDDETITYYGPSVLVQTDLLAMNFTEAVPPEDGTGKDDKGHASNAATASCSVHGALNKNNENIWPLRPVKNASQIDGVATSVFSPCLKSFAAKAPISGRIYGVDYANGGSKGFVDWREMYFNCAIMISDDLRSNKGTVYTVGIGHPASLDPNANGKVDPYQSSSDVGLRHDVLNTRLAADIYRAVDTRTEPYPEFSFDGYEKYEDFSAANESPGVYLASPKVEDLERMFQEIAQQILLKLTE